MTGRRIQPVHLQSQIFAFRFRVKGTDERRYHQDCQRKEPGTRCQTQQKTHPGNRQVDQQVQKAVEPFGMRKILLPLSTNTQNGKRDEQNQNPTHHEPHQPDITSRHVQSPQVQTFSVGGISSRSCKSLHEHCAGAPAASALHGSTIRSASAPVPYPLPAVGTRARAPKPARTPAPSQRPPPHGHGRPPSHPARTRRCARELARKAQTAADANAMNRKGSELTAMSTAKTLPFWCGDRRSI